jgi:hypothetical protein
MAIKTFANLGPRAALRLSRPYALDTTLNFCGPSSLNVIFRLAVEARQQFRSKLRSFGCSQSQRVVEKIACRLTHGVMIPSTVIVVQLRFDARSLPLKHKHGPSRGIGRTGYLRCCKLLSSVLSKLPLSDQVKQGWSV